MAYYQPRTSTISGTDIEIDNQSPPSGMSRFLNNATEGLPEKIFKSKQTKMAEDKQKVDYYNSLRQSGYSADEATKRVNAFGGPNLIQKIMGRAQGGFQAPATKYDTQTGKPLPDPYDTADAKSRADASKAQSEADYQGSSNKLLQGILQQMNPQGAAPASGPAASNTPKYQVGFGAKGVTLKPDTSAQENADYEKIIKSQPGDPNYKIAESLANGTMTPQFFRTLGGYGSKGSATRRALYDKATQINPNFNEAQFELGLSTAKTSMGAFERQANLAEGFSKTAKKNLDLALQYSKKVDRTGAPALNQVWQAFQQGAFQDPTLKAFKNIVLTATNEYAKVMTGSTGGSAVTDAASKKADELLAATDSQESFEAAYNVMLQEMDNRISGIKEQRKSMADEYGNMSGGIGGDQSDPLEGKMAVNPQTGQRIVRKGGKWQLQQ